MSRRTALHIARPWGAVLSAVMLLLGSEAAAGQAVLTDVSIRRAVVHEVKSFPATSVEALQFSPDSQVLACGTSGGQIALLDVTNGNILRVLRPTGDAVTSLAFAPERPLLVSSDFGGHIDVWDVQTGDVVLSIEEPSAVREVGFAASGRYLVAVGDEGEVRIWESEGWTSLPSIVGHTGPIYAFAISPEDDLIVTGAGGDDPTIRLWTFPEGDPLGTDLYEGHVYDIEYSPSHRQVAISGTQPTVWLWEVDRVDFLHLIFGARAPVADIAYSSRGNGLVMVSENGEFRYQRVPSVFEQRMIPFDHPLSAVAFSDDRMYIACGDRAGAVFLLFVP